MSLTSQEIAEVVGELQALEGAFVQRLYLPEPRTLVLDVRQPGESRLVLVSAEVGRTRLHAAEERPPSPEPPLPMQAVFRAELVGLALERIDALPGERAARLSFRGPEQRRVLLAELTGRHGNLFLLDEAGQVRASAVPNVSTLRDNRPGRPYIPPLARESPPPGDDRSRFPEAGPFGRSRAIEALYRERTRAAVLDDRRRLLLQGLRARRERLERTLGKVEQDLARAMSAEGHLRRGELLKANLHRLQRGQRAVELVEYTESGPRTVTVPLDPAKGPKENLDHAFHQYRRLLAGQARSRARLAEVRAELDGILGRLRAVESASDDELLAARPAGRPQPAPGRKRAAPSLPFREFVSPSGQRIRVGRGSEANDALTFKHSKGNDLWFHARGLAGAHVVVPLGRSEPVKEETLRDAALLAAQHSKARGEDAIEVQWTQVKYVRRIKGGAPGAVTLSQEKTMRVRRDSSRLALLREASDDVEPV